MKTTASGVTTIALIVALSLLNSCSPNLQSQVKDYKATIRSGIKVLPWPKEMETLFGDGDHFITHYNMSPGPKTWNTEVFFGGRYVLTLQVDVEVAYSKREVGKVVGTPMFFLHEVESVAIGPTGAYDTRFSRNWNFGEAKWKTLVSTKGDWSSIGIKVKTNSPVENFDYYVKHLRAPRIQVPH